MRTDDDDVGEMEASNMRVSASAGNTADAGIRCGEGGGEVVLDGPGRKRRGWCQKRVQN
jgi:hypothetical protein